MVQMNGKCEHLSMYKEAVYRYCRPGGEVYARKLKLRCRDCNRKTFKWSHIKASGVWVGGRGSEVYPYGVELLLELAGQDRVWIVEGEKDVQALVRHGELAISSPDGAGSWEPEWADQVMRVVRPKAVIVVADKDAAGRKHAQEVATSFADWEPEGLGVFIVEPEYGKDVADHFDGGGTLAELVPHVEHSLSTGLADQFNACRLRLSDERYATYEGPTEWVSAQMIASSAECSSGAGVDTLVAPGDILDPYEVRVRCTQCNAYITPWKRWHDKNKDKWFQGRPCYRCRYVYTTTKEQA